jgi:hypothetical protein
LINYDLLRAEVTRHPFPLLFATISGAHLYGFPSADSDYDLRGVHILSARDAVGLLPKQETVEFSGLREGIELDLVTHDALYITPEEKRLRSRTVVFAACRALDS